MKRRRKRSPKRQRVNSLTGLDRVPETLDDRFISTSEYCAFRGISTSLAQLEAGDGTGPPYFQKTARGPRYYQLSVVREWLAERLQSSTNSRAQ